MRLFVPEVVQRGDRFFRWRGGNVSRLEGVFDAVVALAMTLIIVSVEVPGDFSDLMNSLYRLPAFAICFTIILMCWYYHYLFHRRYGLEDYPTTLFNGLVMFLILIYVYPLKFLYSVLFRQANNNLTTDQLSYLMWMYSTGFLLIFLTYFLMYGYAYLKRESLKLNINERLLTLQKMCEHLIYVGVAIGSLVLAIFPKWLPWSGMIYVALGPLHFINALGWGRQLDESLAIDDQQESEDTATPIRSV